MTGFLKRIFGDGNKRKLKQLEQTANDIDALENDYEQLTDEQIQEKTTEFKERFQNGETLDDLLVEAYALVREASKRVLSMRPFNVQLLGAIALHNGDIAEVKTGEGKTLASTMHVHLNALSSNGVHIIPVNDH